jgi:hypothetical protein
MLSAFSHIGIGNFPQRTLWKRTASNDKQPSPDECSGSLFFPLLNIYRVFWKNTHFGFNWDTDNAQYHITTVSESDRLESSATFRTNWQLASWPRQTRPLLQALSQLTRRPTLMTGERLEPHISSCLPTQDQHLPFPAYWPFQ